MHTYRNHARVKYIFISIIILLCTLKNFQLIVHIVFIIIDSKTVDVSQYINNLTFFFHIFYFRVGTGRHRLRYSIQSEDIKGARTYLYTNSTPNIQVYF